ncbi:MAG: hypothetical protein C0443_01100 [Comamonadaceae bacterium]|nr:hypothetical protein [Comamonadaceae bacterium]
MKLHLSTGYLLLVLSPSLGVAADRVAHPLPSDAPPAVLLPISADSAEPRSNSGLRDVLRQPFSETKEDKRYRLSVQERQRLREQLSSQSLYDVPRK